MKIHYADIVFAKMQDIHSDFNLKQIMSFIMACEYLEMYDEFENIISKDIPNAVCNIGIAKQLDF